MSAQSWLSPSGEFHPVSNNHASMAIDLAGGEDVAGGAVAALFKKGWMRVTYYGNSLYLSNDFRQPNHRQTRAARDFALESGRFSKVMFDSGEDERELTETFGVWLLSH